MIRCAVHVGVAMKGVVFTEFLDFTAALYGHDMVDDIIDDANLSHGGAYTSVGTYPFTEMQRLVTALTMRSKQPLSDLMSAFGDHLCQRFAIKYPEFFRSQSNLFDFVESVDRHIHVEVHKLYPDAELPRFSTQARDARTLIIDYRSCRPLEALAEGMIKAAAVHYGEVVSVERTRLQFELSDAVRFTVTRAA